MAKIIVHKAIVVRRRQSILLNPCRFVQILIEVIFMGFEERNLLLLMGVFFYLFCKRILYFVVHIDLIRLKVAMIFSVVVNQLTFLGKNNNS